jgi:hypothetical protein
MIMLSFGLFFPMPRISEIAGIIGLVLWIVYWVKAVKLGKSIPQQLAVR